MATFQVPQFIDQKPKIVGPLTLKQFAFIATASLLSFLAYYTFNFFLWIVISVLLESVAILLAFGKINGQEATLVLKSVFRFFLEPRLFLWERNFSVKKVEESEKLKEVRTTMSIEQKLKSITLNITTGKAFSPRARSEKKENKEGFEVATFSTGEKRFVKKMDYNE